jgi:CRP/FNR family transcriptional regulator
VLITDIAGPGDVLGLSAIVSCGAHEVTAETLDACRLVFFEREKFLQLLGASACALAHAMRQLSRNYRTVHRQASVLGLSPTAAGKLACVLLEHPSLNGVRVGRGFHFRLVLTHEEIGQLIGASRETCNAAPERVQEKAAYRGLGRNPHRTRPPCARSTGPAPLLGRRY